MVLLLLIFLISYCPGCDGAWRWMPSKQKISCRFLSRLPCLRLSTLRTTRPAAWGSVMALHSRYLLLLLLLLFWDSPFLSSLCARALAIGLDESSRMGRIQWMAWMGLGPGCWGLSSPFDQSLYYLLQNLSATTAFGIWMDWSATRIGNL